MLIPEGYLLIFADGFFIENQSTLQTFEKESTFGGLSQIKNYYL